jgi:hypothetical protein
MTDIIDGWIHGELPGPEGPIEVVRFPREDMKPWSKLAKNPPNLCLHTTEGGPDLGERYKTWEFPPNFACGDFKVVQLFPLGFSSKAVDTKDPFLLQIEMAWRVADKPVVHVYLPDPSTLFPTVALVAFLHSRELITTGLKRPNPDWPVALDRGPQARDDYYRRNDGTWPKHGVYGHVEMPDDEHWDPGSFDYPRFFEMVREVIEEGDLTPDQERSLKRLTTFLETLTEELGHHDQGDRVRAGDDDDDLAAPAGAAKRVARMILKSEEP